MFIRNPTFAVAQPGLPVDKVSGHAGMSRLLLRVTVVSEARMFAPNKPAANNPYWQDDLGQATMHMSLPVARPFPTPLTDRDFTRINPRRG